MYVGCRSANVIPFFIWTLQLFVPSKISQHRKHGSQLVRSNNSRVHSSSAWIYFTSTRWSTHSDDFMQWTDLTPQNAAINAGVTRHNPWKIMVSMCVGCTDRWKTRKKSVARNKQIKYGNNKHTVTPTTGLVPLRLTQALWSSHQKHGITNQTEDQSLTLSWF